MANDPAGTKNRRLWVIGSAVWLFLGIVLLFHGAGNATRGYLDTTSAWVWWSAQWFNPGSDLEHTPFLLLAVAVLAWRNGARWTHLPTRPEAGIAVVALLAGLVVLWLGWHLQQTRFSLFGAASALLGVVFWAGGQRGGRALAGPMVFLLFTLPWGFVLQEVGFHLRMLVLTLARGISHLGGLEIIQSGTLLTNAAGTYIYDVAPACSGTRSLLILSALSLGVGYLVFRHWWRRGLLLALALPFALVGNVVRILLIMLAAQILGPAAGDFVHEWFGFVIFLVVLGLALGVVTALEKWLPEKPAQAPWPPVWKSAPKLLLPTGLQMTWPVGMLALMLGLGIYLRGPASMNSDAEVGIYLTADATAPRPLPRLLGVEWLGTATPVSPVEREILPADTGFARMLYEDMAGRQIFLSLVLSGRDRSSIHRPELCLTGQGWTITDQQKTELTLGGGVLPVTLLTLEREASATAPTARSLFVYWFVHAEGVAGSNAARLGQDLRLRLRGRAPRWAYVVVQTPWRESEAATLEALRPFLEEALPVFQNVSLPAT